MCMLMYVSDVMCNTMVQDLMCDSIVLKYKNSLK